MKKLKHSLLSILGAALILSSSSVSASTMNLENDPFLFDVQPSNEVVQTQAINHESENPNENREIDGVLQYNQSEEEYSVQSNEPVLKSEFPITTQSQGGVMYSIMLLPLEGTGETEILYRINGFVGSKPNRIDLDIELYRGNERGTSGRSVGGCKAIVQGILNVKVGKTVTCTKKTSETGFYFAEVNSVVKNILGIPMGTDSAQSSQLLLNKHARIYPFHFDPWSGKTMTEPARADWTRTPSVEWTSNDRYEYIKKYSELHPSNGWNWNGVVTHIHHVRPRNLGGTNDYNNLIPIPRTVHEGLVSPWFAAY